jgi:hypothetical protein
MMMYGFYDEQLCVEKTVMMMIIYYIRRYNFLFITASHVKIISRYPDSAMSRTDRGVGRHS